MCGMDRAATVVTTVLEEANITQPNPAYGQAACQGWDPYSQEAKARCTSLNVALSWGEGLAIHALLRGPWSWG